jgi:choline dehydrogenase-like flavoprotein
MHYVVGSGPAGIAAAHALVERGVRVTMLDAGGTIAPDIAKDLTQLGKEPPERWSRKFIARMKERTRAAEAQKTSIPTKLVYGSDYPYRGIRKHYPIDAHGAWCQPSLAQGGLSTVWGASMLPFAQEDMHGWLVTQAQLEPHYEAVLRFVDLAAQDDELAARFPLYTERPQAHTRSAQAQALLERWRANAKELSGAGFSFGGSRLAVRSQPKGGAPGCVYCGLCLYGCPYNLIYSSAHTLEKLNAHAKFSYVKGIVATRVEEASGRVRIHATKGGKDIMFEGERVFLACGTLPTTTILLRSLGLTDTPVTIRDSRYFVLPALMKGIGEPTSERLHTLAQLFLELRMRGVSRHNVHTQLYTYNDLMDARLDRMLGPMRTILAAPKRALLRRLVVLLGFMHSDESAAIELVLRKDGTIHLRAKGDAGRDVARRAASALWQSRRFLGLLPITPMLEVGMPGKSYHYGSSFPMRASPKRLESDVLGRPFGFSRVHAVDATVLPSVPGTTITFTIMANAHRIASEVEL